MAILLKAGDKAHRRWSFVSRNSPTIPLLCDKYLCVQFWETNCRDDKLPAIPFDFSRSFSVNTQLIQVVWCTCYLHQAYLLTYWLLPSPCISMDNFPGVAIGGIAYKTQHQLDKCQLDQMYFMGSDQTILSQKNLSCYRSLDVPMHAMEFLSRSWSPSASDFLQALSSTNNNLTFDGQRYLADNEDDTAYDVTRKLEDEASEEEEESEKHGNDVQQKGCKEIYANNVWKNLKNVKGFFIGMLPPMSFGWHREKKQEVRLRTAKIHSALSVAQLAAAIAGHTAANSVSDLPLESGDGAIVPHEASMSNVVAYAATLLATVCAEAAESAGAPKDQVASAISSGLATQSLPDLMTLIATTATCLRGSATLEPKAKAMPGIHSLGNKELGRLTAKLSIITPSGNRTHRIVAIYSKEKQLMLSLQKKCLGMITASREYAILHARGETTDQGYCLLTVKCSGGDIKLLFEDREQSFCWMSNISKILQMYHSS